MREAPWSAARRGGPPSNPLRQGGSCRYRTPRCLRHRHFQSCARFPVPAGLLGMAAARAARVSPITPALAALTPWCTRPIPLLEVGPAVRGPRQAVASAQLCPATSRRLSEFPARIRPVTALHFPVSCFHSPSLRRFFGSIELQGEASGRFGRSPAAGASRA